MESPFRRSIKQYKPILWFVLAGMIGSYLSVFFVRAPLSSGSYIAKVNGNVISAREYQRSLASMQAYITGMQNYAAASNIPFDFFMNMLLGGSDIQTFVLENAIKAEIMRNLSDNLGIQLDEKKIQEELVKGLPASVIDATGAINMQAYTDFANRLGMTIADYEAEKTLEMKRFLVEKVIAIADYAPRYELTDMKKQMSAKKSFEILQFELQDFLKKEAATAISSNDLDSYYEKNKNDYRQQELRRLQYFIIPSKNNDTEIKVDEASIQAYYEKNKSNQFRVAPKVSVRRLLVGNDAASNKKANDLYTLLQQDASQFTHLVKQHSQDADSAKNGGVLPLFSRGKYDTELENAAFRLQKEGDVSPVFKTALGYEILQLVERVNAVEKPLSDVREQIVKIIKTRKATAAVKSDIEVAIGAAKENVQALQELAAKYKATISTSNWLAKGGNYKELEAQLAEKVFNKGAVTKKAGYFSFNTDYVVYFPAEIRESNVPALSEIKNKVEQDYAQARAQDDLRNVVEQTKRKALENNTSFKELAAATGARVIETGMISDNDKTDKLKDLGELQHKLCMLSAKNQVVQYAHKNDMYLGRVVRIEAADESFEDKVDSVETKSPRNANLSIQSFIASLRRNATIEIKKEALNGYNRS